MLTFCCRRPQTEIVNHKRFVALCARLESLVFRVLKILLAAQAARAIPAIFTDTAYSHLTCTMTTYLNRPPVCLVAVCGGLVHTIRRLGLLEEFLLALACDLEIMISADSPFACLLFFYVKWGQPQVQLVLADNPFTVSCLTLMLALGELAAPDPTGISIPPLMLTAGDVDSGKCRLFDFPSLCTAPMSPPLGCSLSVFAVYRQFAPLANSVNKSCSRCDARNLMKKQLTSRFVNHTHTAGCTPRVGADAAVPDVSIAAVSVFSSDEGLPSISGCYDCYRAGFALRRWFQLAAGLRKVQNMIAMSTLIINAECIKMVSVLPFAQLSPSSSASSCFSASAAPSDVGSSAGGGCASFGPSLFAGPASKRPQHNPAIAMKCITHAGESPHGRHPARSSVTVLTSCCCPLSHSANASFSFAQPVVALRGYRRPVQRAGLRGRLAHVFPARLDARDRHQR